MRRARFSGNVRNFVPSPTLPSAATSPAPPSRGGWPPSPSKHANRKPPGRCSQPERESDAHLSRPQPPSGATCAGRRCRAREAEMGAADWAAPKVGVGRSRYISLPGVGVSLGVRRPYANVRTLLWPPVPICPSATKLPSGSLAALCDVDWFRIPVNDAADLSFAAVAVVLTSDNSGPRPLLAQSRIGGIRTVVGWGYCRTGAPALAGRHPASSLAPILGERLHGRIDASSRPRREHRSNSGRRASGEDRR